MYIRLSLLYKRNEHRAREMERKRKSKKAKEEHTDMVKSVRCLVRAEKRFAIHQPHRFHYYQPSCITNIYSLESLVHSNRTAIEVRYVYTDLVCLVCSLKREIVCLLKIRNHVERTS